MFSFFFFFFTDLYSKTDVIHTSKNYNFYHIIIKITYITTISSSSSLKLIKRANACLVIYDLGD